MWDLVRTESVDGLIIETERKSFNSLRDAYLYARKYIETKFDLCEWHIRELWSLQRDADSHSSAPLWYQIAYAEQSKCEYRVFKT